MPPNQIFRQILSIAIERVLCDFERGFQTEGIQDLLPVCQVNVG